jgi:hypothetical protein
LKGVKQYVECIIYNQKSLQKEYSDAEVKERLWQNACSFEAFYYYFFIVLLLGFIYGTKNCSELPRDEGNNIIIEPERQLRIDSGLEDLTYLEMFCKNQNNMTVLFGSLFIMFAVSKAFYRKSKNKAKL